MREQEKLPEHAGMTERERRHTLAACALLTIGLGISYSWSVFVTPLSEVYGCTSGQASIAYTMTNILCPVSMLVSGLLLPKTGEKKLLRAASFLALVGLLLLGAWPGLGNLYLCYGLIAGFGTSTLYGIVATFGPKIYPERSGMATGVIVTGLGIGMLLIPIVSQALLNRISIIATIRILGIALFILAQISLIFMKEPPAASPEKAGGGSWKDIFRTPSYYLLLLIMFGGATTGLLLVSQTAVIGAQRIGMTAEAAAGAVSVVAVANTAGRFVWGSLSDYLGRYKTLGLEMAFSACMLAVLCGTKEGTVVRFLISAAGVGFAYGGFMSMLPPLCHESLGQTDSTFKFGAVYVGFAAGGFIGPMLPSWFGNEHTVAFITAAVINIICIVFVVLLNRQGKRTQKEERT